MNWNKGAKTKGRGTSFKGALLYYLHDKGRAETTERVGFVELVNLATDDPNDAWREMMATAEAADELKRRAGLATAKTRNTRPVYAFSIQWHPDDNYELKMGVIRSPERRAKFAALDAGLKPAPKPKTPKRFQEPDTKAANDDIPMRQRAQAIRDQQRAYAAHLKATQDEGWKQRAKEQRALWNDYRTARQAIRARYQFQIDQIYRHKRNRHALPLSIQGFRDWKETQEWQKLMARLKADRRRFEYREKTLFGFVGNAIALTRSGMLRTGKGLLPMLFNLLVSAQARREIMTARHALATRALSNKQFGNRKSRADRVKAVLDAQMQGLSVAFDIQKAALDQRHEQEIAAQKLGWRDLAAERKKLWDEWREEFGIRQRQQRTGTTGGGSRSSGDRRRRPVQPTSQFPDAGKKVPADFIAGGSTKKQSPKAVEQFLGAGKPLRKTPTRPADSGLTQEFKKPAKNSPSNEPGYKKRRSAAERKADGTYKPRIRKGPSL